VLVERTHKDVAVAALVVEGAELRLPDPAGKFLGGGEGAGGEGGDDRDVRALLLAVLGEHGAPAIDHDREAGVGLLEVVAEKAVDLGDIFLGEERDGLHGVSGPWT